VDHEYQLVLQLPEDCPLTSLDFEDEIAEAVGNPRGDEGQRHFVDGNSFGGGTIEFFIHTNDPIAAFGLVSPLLQSAGLLDMVTAGYRRFEEDEFTVVWPIGFRGEFLPC
jgi:hypothetical protein